MKFARRDPVIIWLANQLIRLTSKHYQTVTKNLFMYGLQRAADDRLLDDISGKHDSACGIIHTAGQTCHVQTTPASGT